MSGRVELKVNLAAGSPRRLKPQNLKAHATTDDDNNSLQAPVSVLADVGDGEETTHFHECGVCAAIAGNQTYKRSRRSFV